MSGLTPIAPTLSSLFGKPVGLPAIVRGLAATHNDAFKTGQRIVGIACLSRSCVSDSVNVVSRVVREADSSAVWIGLALEADGAS